MGIFQSCKQCLSPETDNSTKQKNSHQENIIQAAAQTQKQPLQLQSKANLIDINKINQNTELEKFNIEFSPGELMPFFDGKILQERMKIVRHDFIEPIRANYNKTLFDENMNVFKTKYPQSQLLINRIQYSYWNDAIKENKKFHLIKGYTNEQMCKTIMRLISSVLRSKELVNDKLLSLAVFLIEAINIQLFLLIKTRPQLKNFSGKVYRGIACSVQDFQKFEKLYSQKNLIDRIISVPLSLWSCSKNINVAKSFFSLRGDSSTKKIVLCINVINLDPNDLPLYQSRFPTSIVSSICAVDISDKQLTYHPKEEEVILRGAFCLILDIINKGNYYQIQCVTVNSNRDHISTNHLGDQAQAARDLFASINKKARLNFAENYFKEKPEFEKEHKFFSDQATQEIQRFIKIREAIFDDLHTNQKI